MSADAIQPDPCTTPSLLSGLFIPPMPSRRSTSSNWTHRCSSAEMPAPMAMISATSPSRPEHGAGLPSCSACTNAIVSCLYASLYRLMKKSNGMSALPQNLLDMMRAVFGNMLSVISMPLVPSTSARWS
jgi:hypothetical protein